MAYPLRTCVIALVTSSLVYLILCFSSSTSALLEDQPIRTMVNLVLVHVSVLDNETEHPIQGLRVHDFEVFENGSTLRPLIFWTGSQPGSESTMVWFLVSCPDRSPARSGSVPWDSGVLKSALTKLDSTYTFGIAHWCNADANIDVPPTQDRAVPLATIDGILHRTPVKSSGVDSALGFQRSLLLIAKESNLHDTRALRAIIVLGGETLPMSKEEADLTAKRLLYNGAILYQVGNRSLTFISSQTGGLTYSVQSENYGNAVNSILDALRFRYTIGVFPTHPTDHWWHELRVQLAENVRQEHKSVHIAHSAGYFSATSPYSVSNYQHMEGTGSETSSALAVDDPDIHQIHFAADARAFVGLDHLVEFTLRLNSDQLVWSNSSNGSRQSQIVVAFTSYSQEGRALARGTLCSLRYSEMRPTCQ